MISLERPAFGAVTHLSHQIPASTGGKHNGSPLEDGNRCLVSGLLAFKIGSSPSVEQPLDIGNRLIQCRIDFTLVMHMLAV